MDAAFFRRFGYILHSACWKRKEGRESNPNGYIRAICYDIMSSLLGQQ